jgi:hypothetical protein
MHHLSLPLRLKFAAVLGLVLLGPASAQEPSASAGIDPRAQAAVERSRITTGTYALYNWQWARDPNGRPWPSWSAEFHHGNLHRVEMPYARVVADCAARTGTLLLVPTGERQTGEAIASSACGVASNAPVISLEWLGQREHRFGRLDMVRLVDPAQVRTYAIDRSGVLVAAEILPRDPSARDCLQNEALAIERTLPEGDIFSEASLDRIVTPERYRTAPPGPVGDLWTREPFCF